MLEAVFSVQSMPRLYNNGQLPLGRLLSLEVAVRKVGCWCEMAASLGVSGVELLYIYILSTQQISKIIHSQSYRVNCAFILVKLKFH
jgi:hypothetical protein